MHTPLQLTVCPTLGTSPVQRPYWAQCPMTARQTCPPSPRAPLPSPGVTLQRVMSTITSVTVTPPSSLLRAHAPDRSLSRRLVVTLAFRVLAGCCRPRLGIDPSRPYLCESFPGCLAPYPGCLPKCSCSLLPLDHRPSLSSKQVGFQPQSTQRLQCGLTISGLQAFSYVQTSRFARHPGRSHHNGLHRRAAVTFTSGHRAVSLFPHSGYATRLNRAIDGRGLSPPRFAALSAAPRTL
jgi:hypothetical protein